jgi:putative cardiolipin synthase
VARIIKERAGGDDPETLAPIDAPDEALGPMEAPALRRGRWINAARRAFSGEAALLADAPAQRDPAAVDETPDQLARVLIAWIERAREELVIVSAYLIPTAELEAAVERAEKRGVRVRKLTNSLRSNNHTAAHAIYRRHIARIMAHGADLHEVRNRAKDRALYMQAPVDDKRLGLHSKLLVIDREISFIGSPNLDPRSLHLNTEMGIIVRSRELNRRIRRALAIDFSHRNAWQLRTAQSGAPIWIGDDAVLTEQPAASWFQRLEDWFLGLLPIEDEM